jgi:ribosomal protein L11
MIKEEYSIIYLSFNLEARGAEVAPPLSTVIGNEGLNAKSFCDDFNILTADLPLYFKLKVFLMIDKSNRK